jgi:hypothetical protein
MAEPSEGGRGSAVDLGRLVAEVMGTIPAFQQKPPDKRRKQDANLRRE